VTGIISYMRVSTQKQGRSGLGLEAQRAAIARFAASEGREITAEFIEVETGKGADALDRRPELAAALKLAKKAKCEVVVAKLCRLSRDVHFISGLMAERVPFVVADLGRSVPTFMLHIYAAAAQEERRLIAQRTKDALAVAKAKGKQLGIPKLVKAAIARDKVLQPIFQNMAGRSLRTIAAELDRRGIKSWSGKPWNAPSVRNAMLRLGLGGKS
jgi:DNA invertase Pin-like site-specific DNA recombinase